jgi:uncharacterized delta-60 repeat protein
MAIQPWDGKIVVAGRSQNVLTVARFNTDGTVDSTFGSGGFVNYATSSESQANTLALQSDHKIVVAGGWNNQLLVLRYNSNGSLDTSFNGALFPAAPFSRPTPSCFSRMDPSW